MRDTPLSQPPPAAVEDLLRTPPTLHHWEGAWHCGGITADGGRAIAAALAERPVQERNVAETGAGLSTLLFLACGVSSLVTVEPNVDLHARIHAEAAARRIDVAPLRFVRERSELALPRLCDDGHTVDVALIDGDHGWPTALLDFCYQNHMRRQDGLLFVDDVGIHSVRELALLLRSQTCAYELLAGVPEKPSQPSQEQSS